MHRGCQLGVTRIGVFGGQFDPPHNGHVAVVRAARDQLGLDRLLVVPSPHPPHRPSPRTPAETRYRLALAAFADERGVEVSRLELDRAGPSYTADTLQLLAGPGRELFLILGADQLAALDSWHRPDRVRELARVAVAARSGAAHADDAQELVMHPVDVSSSELRRRVANGMDVTGLVPAAVSAAIAREGLYAPTPC
jgi:nicotinate-nucleotide adenylyltransferase